MAAKGRKDHKGVVLFSVLAAVAAIGLLAATVAVMAIADVRMTGHFMRGLEALYAADAGVQYVKTRIEADLASGALVLDSVVETVSYAAPTGMTFDTVTTLVQMPNTNAYVFSLTGRSLTARATVETVFQRGSSFEMGVYGKDLVDIKGYGAIYSYYSDDTPNPTPADSTGEALVGTGGDFYTHQDTMIDGSFMMGPDESGTYGDWRETPAGGSIITGEAAVPSDYADPDPLGVASGALAATFVHYSVASNNSNASATPAITPPQNRVLLHNGETMTLTAGNYYVASMVLMNGSSLLIDASSGPVNIYLTGKLEAKEGSSINVTGSPTDFAIFSNSDEALILKHNGDFRGLVYAPYADVQVRNSGDFYGVVWGDTIGLFNSGVVCVDLSIGQKYPSNRITLVSWKEVR